MIKITRHITHTTTSNDVAWSELSFDEIKDFEENMSESDVIDSLKFGQLEIETIVEEVPDDTPRNTRYLRGRSSHSDS